jgi:hypothetical protein
MEIIDLLNKIANNEETPEHVDFGGNIYKKFTDGYGNYVIDYLDFRGNSLFDFKNGYRFCFIKSCLEWEVEPVKEKQKLMGDIDGNH